MTARSLAVVPALMGLLLLAQPLSPATATTIIFSGPTSGLDGADGNIRTFSGGGLTVQASAWSTDGTTVQAGWLGLYSGGLGVTSPGEGAGGGASHTVDNHGGGFDFILLVFNQPVTLASAVLTPFSIGNTLRDNDAFVSVANAPGAFTTPATALLASDPVWAALAAGAWTVNGSTTTPFSVALNAGSASGNLWVIGATTANPDSRNDAFKLKSVTIAQAVPEPSGWAMLLLGFGAAGMAMRRARSMARAGVRA